jgi:hypothetical protein
MLGVLRGDTLEYTMAIEENQRRRVLRMIGDYGSHFDLYAREIQTLALEVKGAYAPLILPHQYNGAGH